MKDFITLLPEISSIMFKIGAALSVTGFTLMLFHDDDTWWPPVVGLFLIAASFAVEAFIYLLGLF